MIEVGEAAPEVQVCAHRIDGLCVGGPLRVHEPIPVRDKCWACERFAHRPSIAKVRLYFFVWRLIPQSS
jgi:hypothetical protein